MKEIWKDLQGFNKYQVSSFGRVKSKKRIVKNRLRDETILKPSCNKKGYLQVCLIDNDNNYKTRKVHRLVASAFIQNIYNLPQVNHIDGDKKNNKIDNLEWCTNLENMRHSYKIGLRDKSEMSKRMRKLGKTPHRNHKRNIFQIDKNTGKVLKKWDYIIDASKELNIKYNTLYNACANQEELEGYIWQFTKKN